MVFNPRFDESGLIPCITTCNLSGDVLMFAFMNKESLKITIESGQACYWSRSRKKLWRKGESSGYTQKVIEMRTDCDQDCIWIKVEVNALENNPTKSATCHTGRKSCFYRGVEINSKSNSENILYFTQDSKIIFDPDEIYKD